MRRLGLCSVLMLGCGRLYFEDTSGSADAPPGTPSCPGFAVFCDGFESGDVSKWTMADLSNAGTINLVSAPVHSGHFALESDVMSGADGYAHVDLAFPTQTTGVFAARGWFDLAVPLTNFDLLFALYGVGDEYVTVGGDNSAMWVATDNSIANGLIDHYGTVATPSIGRWTCVEFVFDFAQRRIQVFSDNVGVLDTVIGDPDPAYSLLEVGGARGDQIGFRVFTDDVVVAHQRIGCM